MSTFGSRHPRTAGAKVTARELTRLVDEDAGSPTESLRVLVATGSAELYGSDRMMFESVAGFIERGHQVVVAFAADGPMVARVRDLGAQVRVTAVPVARRAYLTPAGLVRFGSELAHAVPRLRRVIREIAPDVVYVNTLTLPVWLLAARVARTPAVVHVHEAEAARARPARTALSAPLVAARAVIFNSAHTQATVSGDLSRALPPSCVVPNGVAIDAESPDPRAALDGVVRLVYVGRLSPRKGVDLAVTAVDLLRARGVHAQLDVVGDVFAGYEWYRQELRDLIDKLDLSDRVHLLGFHAFVRDFVRAADIALAPTRRDEPFGNVLIEGVGAKRPFVAAAQHGLMEAGSGLGSVRFAIPDDAQSLADAILDQVENWESRRRAACLDAVELHRRHDPRLYRRRVSAVVEKAVGAGSTKANPTKV